MAFRTQNPRGTHNQFQMFVCFILEFDSADLKPFICFLFFSTDKWRFLIESIILKFLSKALKSPSATYGDEADKR